jgi:hypothetical protein
MRGMVRENIVTPSNFIYPLFIHDEDFNIKIESMPGCERHSLESMLREVGEAYDVGVKSFVLFPKVPDELKTNLGVEAYNPEGIVPRAVRMIKAAFPESIVCTDVALDPYSDQGHDGVVEDGKILNDVTINQLCKQAVCQARAGSDVVAPSDMMVSLTAIETAFFAFEIMISHPFLLCAFHSFRTDVSRPFVMLWIPRVSLKFPFFLTLPNTLLHTMDLSVMPWTATLALEIRKPTSKILPTVGKLWSKLLWMPLKVPTC